MAIKTIFFIFLLNTLNAQVKHSHDILHGFLQIKDQHNLGMVFSGVQTEYRYGAQWKINNHEILYQPRLGFGFVFNRGMLGFQLPKIVPVNTTWTRQFYEKNGHTLKAGTNFVADYSFHGYPFLQGGHLFWSTEIGVSGIVQYIRKRFAIYVQNSLFGLTSHTQDFHPYFFSIKVGDWVAKAHENMKFGSYNTYNSTTVSFEFVPNISKKRSFLYEFDYFGSFYGMKFFRISHNLIWRIEI